MRPWPFSHRERVGGKSRLGEEPGALFPQGGLIVFDDQKVIGAALLHQMTGGVGLGVQRIGGDQGSLDRQFAQELRQHRDLVGFFRHGDLGEDGFIGGAEGAEQVQPVGAFERLAVDTDQRVLGAATEQPLTQQLIELGGIDRAQHPLEGALAGRFPPLGLGIKPGPQGAQLGLGQLGGDRGQIGQRAAAGEDAYRRSGEHPVEPVAPAGLPPRVEQLAKHRDQPGQGGHPEVIAPWRLPLKERQGLRQVFGAQPLGRAGVQRLHPKFLRAVMFLIIVAAGPGPARGPTQRLPVGRLVTGPLIPLRVDKTFHQDDGMPVDPQIVLPQSVRSQLQEPAGQIGTAHLW
jgi:hypothetical protein